MSHEPETVDLAPPVDLGWTCPKCGSDCLDVQITTWARLEQEDDHENFQTDTTEAQFQDHEWDNNSLMQCRDCGCAEPSSRFRVGLTKEETNGR